MDGAREQLLAGAGLAEEQHRRVGVGDVTDLLEGRAEGGASTDDLAEIPRVADLGLEVDVLGLEAFAEPLVLLQRRAQGELGVPAGDGARDDLADQPEASQDRNSTRLNSSHLGISYAVF